MRQRYRYDAKTGRMVDRDGFPMLSHNELAHDESQIRAPMVMRDIPEYLSPIDGRPITSRSHRRYDLESNGCVEVDPPKKPTKGATTRGLKNKRFATKHRAKPNELIV